MVPVTVVSKPKTKIPHMNKSTRLIITAAAMAGLYAGALVVKASAKPDAGTTAPAAGDKAKDSCKGKNDCKGKGGCGATKGKNDCKGKGGCNAAAMGHSCAGKNDCKGKGGCKTGDAGCKGKNSCKGKGGCKSA